MALGARPHEAGYARPAHLRERRGRRVRVVLLVRGVQGQGVGVRAEGGAASHHPRAPLLPEAPGPGVALQGGGRQDRRGGAGDVQGGATEHRDQGHEGLSLIHI